MNKTPEQIAAETAAAEAAKKAQAAAEKKAADKAAKELAATAKKEAATKAAADKKAIKDAAAAAKAAAKAEADAAKAAAKAAKVAVKQPEQNDVVAPKPGTACGKIWALADSLSKKAGAPVAIKSLLEIAQAEGFNDATIKTQYARWRKFHGVTGRVAAPAPVVAPVTEQTSAPAAE